MKSFNTSQEGIKRQENDEFPSRLRILTNPAGGRNYHVVIAKGCYREWKPSETVAEGLLSTRKGQETTRER